MAGSAAAGFVLSCDEDLLRIEQEAANPRRLSIQIAQSSDSAAFTPLEEQHWAVRILDLLCRELA
jgi:hypothetical protein